MEALYVPLFLKKVFTFSHIKSDDIGQVGILLMEYSSPEEAQSSMQTHHELAVLREQLKRLGWIQDELCLFPTHMKENCRESCDQHGQTRWQGSQGCGQLLYRMDIHGECLSKEGYSIIQEEGRGTHTSVSRWFSRWTICTGQEHSSKRL